VLLDDFERVVTEHEELDRARWLIESGAAVATKWRNPNSKKIEAAIRIKPTMSGCPFDRIARFQRWAMVAHLLGRLPRRTKQLLDLRYRRGLSHREIGLALRLHEDAALRMHDEAMLILRGELARFGIASMREI